MPEQTSWEAAGGARENCESRRRLLRMRPMVSELAGAGHVPPVHGFWPAEY